jgi:hypothetical protein
MQEMKNELAAILSALAALGVQKKGGKLKPPGGALPRGPRKPAPGRTAGGAGAGCSTSDTLAPVYARDWIKCYMCRQWGQHIAAECTRTQQEIDNLTPGAKLPPSGPAKDTLYNPNLTAGEVASTTSTGKGLPTSKEQLVLDKENKCKYSNTNAIIGLLMCTAAWINVKVLPVIAAASTSEKGKGDR